MVRIAALSAALACCIPIHASVTYNLRDTRYFPDGAGAPFDVEQNGVFTPTTSASLPVSFSTDPGQPDEDTFDGISSVATGPFLLGTDNSVTINAAATIFQNLGIYSIVESGISDSNVIVTGGTGIGYLLPTFRVKGTIGNSNPNAKVQDLICAGNGTCILNSIFPIVTSGLTTVDGTYTPAVDSTTSFTFGTSFDFFFFFGSNIQESNSPNPGGSSMADLTLQLVSVQVVDANGDPIPGAIVNSAFLSDVNVPEPATSVTVLTALALLISYRRLYQLVR